MLEHVFFRELLQDKHTVRIVDICSGTGIGGFIFSKLLVEKGFDVSLTLIDVRRDALTKGREWILQELGLQPEIYVMDAKAIHELGKEYDLAIVWGSSTPHFDPWYMNKLLSSISYSLSKSGVLVLQESDRIQRIVYEGYRNVNVVEGSGKVVMDVFVSYNPYRGTCRRLVLDLTKQSQHVFMDLFYWSIASLGALLWLFFKDVDIVETSIRKIYVLLAFKPRKTISPKDLEPEPLALKRNG